MNERKYCLLLAMILLTALCARAQDVTTRAQEATADAPAEIKERHHLMPVPASLRFQAGRLPIDASFRVALDGYADARLRSGIERAVKRLSERTGLEMSRLPATDAASAALVIRCKGPGQVVPSVNEDESYTLEVSAKQAVLNAPTAVGALRGLETFLQLLDGDRDGYFIPLAQIQDSPRFPWRGLLIDVCRHWQPIEVVKRNLDGMAAVKLNVLHLHLTENQGFRIESKKYPKLHELGSDGLYYTQEQIREIIAYARERGIRVIPEFDIPGHSTSWLVGHPELGSAPGPYQIERKYGVFDPALDPTREETYKFLERFLGEMAALFPDAYMHIGGDEVTGKHWRLNPKIQEFMQKNGFKDKHALQAYFNRRVSEILRKHGKKMIGWDEILHPDLPKDIVVQSWRGPKSLAEGAKQGYTGILSAGYYLDHLRPASYHYAIDPIRPESGLNAEQTARILGGEACMWGEYVGPENIDSRIWPRLAAVAERFWSPREVTDVADMYRRLEFVSVELEGLGLLHQSYSEKMLRRLAGMERIDALKTLTGVVEPLKNLGRERVNPITQQTPLTRLVDAAGPDSRAARELDALIEGLLDDAPRFQINREAIRNDLNEWRAVHPSVVATAERSPAMREAEPLARQLSDMSAAGLEAVGYLSEGVAPPAGWKDEKLALLDAIAKTKWEVEFAVLPALRRLIVAAGEVGQLKTMSPSEWRAHVTALLEPKK